MEFLTAIIAILLTVISYVFTKTLKEYRYKKWYLSIFLTILSGVTISYFIYTLTDTQKDQHTFELKTQIGRLNDIETSLNDLREFIREQKNRLLEAEKTILELEEKKSKLKPLIEADQKTVEAIFSHLEAKKGRSIWIERLIGLVVGILASLLATMIYKIISTKLKARKPSLSSIRAESSILFNDNFEEFVGWHDYKKGTLSLSKDISSSRGEGVLKKDGYNDPNGGYKIFQKKVELPLIFSGRINRPSNYEGGAADRLAIEDSEFNGYGFAIKHNTNQVWIEKRIAGVASLLGPREQVSIPKDKWYNFKLHLQSNGELELRIYNSSNEQLVVVDGITDDEHKLFDRITVHGGHHYYIDDIKVERSIS